ncbi:hypothetical protein [Roseateles sp.]|uniref:hypothetical protein n=1 Tax=Roseateles sp. TaxID=1971397 RepID=UPI0031DB4FBE
MSARVRSRTARRRVPARQSGFSLLELSFATLVSIVFYVGATRLRQFDQMVDIGRHAGQKLAALSDGARRYVQAHGTALAGRPARCAELALASATRAAPPLPPDCGLRIGDKPPVANALQPTARELQGLGFMDVNDALPFRHGNQVIDGRTGEPAEPRWAVSIRCIEHCAPAPAASGASAPAFSVTVFNTQPFFAAGDLPYGHGAQLNAALRAAGPYGVASWPGDTPQAASRLRGPSSPAASNPLHGTAPGDGVPGVLATFQRVGPGGSPHTPKCGNVIGATCQDGSAKPTENWDFNAKDLLNVGKLAVTADARFDRRVDVSGDVQVGGAAGRSANLVITRGDVELREGRIAVRHGFGDFSDPRSIGDSRLGGIRLPTTLAPGRACDPTGLNPDHSGGNLGLYFDGTAMHVMVCRPHQISARGGGAEGRARQMQGIWTHAGDPRGQDRMQGPWPLQP